MCQGKCTNSLPMRQYTRQLNSSRDRNIRRMRRSVTSAFNSWLCASIAPLLYEERIGHRLSYCLLPSCKRTASTSRMMILYGGQGKSPFFGIVPDVFANIFIFSRTTLIPHSSLASTYKRRAYAVPRLRTLSSLARTIGEIVREWWMSFLFPEFRRITSEAARRIK
jgi:hypothetical protein